jgi:alkyl hydroperoxide reductase subunit AhpC
MAIRLGDVAPDFIADTTEGRISFHEWKGTGWAVLFSHPRDFTPVCTTELGAVAALKSEFDMRNTRVIGLSVDSLEEHDRWKGDIRPMELQRRRSPVVSPATRPRPFARLEATGGWRGESPSLRAEYRRWIKVWRCDAFSRSSLP